MLYGHGETRERGSVELLYSKEASNKTVAIQGETVQKLIVAEGGERGGRVKEIM